MALLRCGASLNDFSHPPFVRPLSLPSLSVSLTLLVAVSFGGSEQVQIVVYAWMVRSVDRVKSYTTKMGYVKFEWKTWTKCMHMQDIWKTMVKRRKTELESRRKNAYESAAAAAAKAGKMLSTLLHWLAAESGKTWLKVVEHATGKRQAACGAGPARGDACHKQKPKQKCGCNGDADADATLTIWMLQLMDTHRNELKMQQECTHTHTHVCILVSVCVYCVTKHWP